MIGIIDYGMGNLFSVTKALERLGARVSWISAPDEMERSEKLILPGVGAFGDAMDELGRRSLVEPIRAAIRSGKPFLGVCLGYQLLFERSEESNQCAGLGILSGYVKKFNNRDTSGRLLKVPHMGWNQVSVRPQGLTIFRGVPEQSYFYFVHSYYPVPKDPGIVAGITDYGVPFPSAVAVGRLFACQFHPEKSHRMGERVLKNFLDLS